MIALQLWLVSTNSLAIWPLFGFGHSAEPQEMGGRRMKSEYVFPGSLYEGSHHIHGQSVFQSDPLDTTPGF